MNLIEGKNQSAAQAPINATNTVIANTLTGFILQMALFFYFEFNFFHEMLGFCKISFIFLK